jgi:uncharacterized protein YkwD
MSRGRTWTIAGAAIALSVAIAGCGGTDASTSSKTAAVHLAPPPPAPAPAGSPVPPGPPTGPPPATDGRLGPASEATDERPGVAVSPGGRPDLGPPAEGEPREGVAAASGCPRPEQSPDADSVADVLDTTVCLVNAERVERGLARLSENARLAEASRRFAADLVAGQYFSHTGRDGSDIVARVRRTGYIPSDRAWAVGENLAWGTGPLATPAAIVRAWMNSPGHRANILNPRFRQIGLGIAMGNPAGAEGGGATYASAFGAIGSSGKRKARRRV